MLHQGRFALKISTCVTTMFFAGAGYAQSSVTLYGILDTGVLYTNKTVGEIANQNAGRSFSLIEGGQTSSIFGLTGTEDLGGGLKVSFKLESGISPASGALEDCNGNLFGCQAWIALDNQYGTLKAGLQYSPFFLAVDESDPRDLDLFGSGLVSYVDNVTGTGIFSPNSVSYTSPELAGFQGSVLLSLGGIAGNFQAGRQYSASLKYELGGFMINASIFDANAGGNAQTPAQTAVEYEGRTIGTAYKIGPVTAKLSFVNYKVSGSFNNNVYGGGLDYHVTPWLEVNGGVWVTSDRRRTANHSVMGALGAMYFVSTRTSFYAQVGAVDNQGQMNTGISTNGATFGVQGTTIAAVVGLRHTF